MACESEPLQIRLQLSGDQFQFLLNLGRFLNGPKGPVDSNLSTTHPYRLKDLPFRPYALPSLACPWLDLVRTQSQVNVEFVAHMEMLVEEGERCAVHIDIAACTNFHGVEEPFSHTTNTGNLWYVFDRECDNVID